MDKDMCELFKIYNRKIDVRMQIVIMKIESNHGRSGNDFVHAWTWNSSPLKIMAVMDLLGL